MRKRAKKLFLSNTFRAVLPKCLGKGFDNIVRVLFADIYKKSAKEMFEKLGISKNKKLALVFTSMAGGKQNK